jgi:hypothetical protein
VDGSRVTDVTRPPETLPVIPRRTEPRLPRSLAIVIGAGWPLLLIVATALAPEAADPEAVPGLIDMVVTMAVMLGLLGTISAAVSRHPSALLWSAGLGLVWVAMAITCPLSGHHDAVGWQWYGDLAASSGLLLVSLIGLGRLRSG